MPSIRPSRTESGPQPEAAADDRPEAPAEVDSEAVDRAEGWVAVVDLAVVADDRVVAADVAVSWYLMCRLRSSGLTDESRPCGILLSLIRSGRQSRIQ